MQVKKRCERELRDFQEPLHFSGEAPEFWLEHCNHKALCHIPHRFLMLAVRYREYMPAEVMKEVDAYLRVAGWTEETQAWADMPPTNRELSYVS